MGVGFFCAFKCFMRETTFAPPCGMMMVHKYLWKKTGRRKGHPKPKNLQEEICLMKITDLIIDPRSLGSKFWLVDVSPAYEYQNNKRTDTVLGYRYAVALPEKGLEKINVRIDGDKRMEAPDGYAEVRFDGLEVFIYWSQGQPQVGAKATGIHLVTKS